MRKWTPEQRDAIDAYGGTLLVSAAAGSGKTSVLSERVIRQLTDPVHPCDADRLLVVTFTKAAAAEMKQRIADRLSAQLAQNPGDHRLQRQKLLLDHAHISTVHSFCSDLLHEHFHELGISPTFRIASPDEMLLISGRVLDELCESIYVRIRDGAPGLAELADLFSDDRDDRRLSEVIRQLYDNVRSHPFPAHWLRKQTEQYHTSAPIAETAWGKVLFTYAQDASEHGVTLLESAMENAAQDEKISVAYRPALMEELLSFVRIHEAAAASDWDALVQAVQRRTAPRLAPVRKADETVKERVKGLRDDAHKIMDTLAGLFDQSEADAMHEITGQYPVIEALSELVIEYGQRLDAAKREKNLLDFGDLEHGALRLLLKKSDTGYQRTPLAIALSQQFEEIMIDEYQDTNGAQELIFSAISRDETNLFMVGDVKQSIYRFRQASPELFIRRRDRYALYDRTHPQFPATILLGKNFRSRNGITGACNYLFRQLMSRAVGDVTYDETEELIPQASYPPGDMPDASLVLIEPNDSDELPEAEWIADRIQTMIRAGAPVQTGDGPRPAQYRDFCILLRSAVQRADDYLRVLQHHHIPCWGTVQGGFFQTKEVSALLALLRVIDNPVQDIPLLAILCSPIYGFSPDELAQIRMAAPHQPLYSALKQSAGNPHVDAFQTDLNRWRRFAAAGTVRGLIERIWDEKQLGAIFAAMTDGELRLANLRLLAEYAVTYEQAGYRGLSGFIRYIDRLQEQHADLTPASVLSESANVVRIMTIHHAKGLEFPFVFMADCAREFNRQSLNGDLLLHPQLGAALRRRDARGARYHTAAYDALQTELARDDMSEQMRVLYVALTRAREKLFLLCTIAHPETRLARLAASLHGTDPIAPFAVRSASHFADWILTALLRHPDMGALRTLAGAESLTILPNDHAWQLEHIAARSFAAPELETEAAAEADPVLLQTLRDRFSFSYDRPALSRIPVKAAISTLAEQAQSRQYRATRRPAFLSAGGLSPAERGTALHTYLQFADYGAAAQDADAELRRLMAQGYLTEEQAAAVESERVAALFSGPLGQRILSARTTHREVRFLLEYPASQWDPAAGGDESVVLQGVADCVLEEDDGLVLIDFKTDRVTDAETLRSRYAQQLQLYAQALAGYFGKPVRERLLYSTHLNCVISLNA